MGMKLIEVALPLEAINAAAAREKSIRHGHPSTLHLWWARRPLAACRAVLFAQLVDDPSAHPDRFPTEAAQERERQRLFRIIEELVKWESSSDEKVLEAARREIRKSCGGDPPPVLDPFCGGGSIPLEAQRLGLEAHASDLNPVAVLITKALIEIPPKFAARPPIHPGQERSLLENRWRGAAGLAEDVRYYGRWMREQAWERIGRLYPRVDLARKQGSGGATVIAWLWARTVRCPNPTCGVDMPLLNSFAVSRRRRREAWLEPVASPGEGKIRFRVRSGAGCPSAGSVSRNGATCLACGTSTPLAYVREEGKAGRMGAQLLCTIAEGDGRAYVEADERQLEAARVDRPADVPETSLSVNPRAITTPNYGIAKHWQLFTNRQLVALTTFCGLVAEAREQVLADGADREYADAVATYLSLTIGRLANRCSSQSFWHAGRDTVEQVFGRNALPMIWVYAEANPFSDSSGNFLGQVGYLAEALARVPATGPGFVKQADATAAFPSRPVVVATDPPYYDNVPYADLSDFFYVWLRRCAGPLHPELFRTVLVPKAEELIAEPARHGGWDAAARFFETGLRRVFEAILHAQSPDAPFTLFYAFKQSEEGEDGNGRISTGWETMLQGLVDSGCRVTGTWPMRTEQTGGLRELGRNSLASSIVLVCRARSKDAGLTDRRGFIAALKRELPRALHALQHGGIAPVDLAQAAIGPGMAVFTGFARVVEADGSAMRVRTALALVNQVLDEILTEQEGDFEPYTRWAIGWFEQLGFDEGPFGRADELARARNVAVDGLVRAGIVRNPAGKVSLVRRKDLPRDWDPATDTRLTVWEATQHLIHALETDGEEVAAALLRKLGGLGDAARELAYRLYGICERRKWAEEARAYNGLVVAWPELARLAAGERAATDQAEMFDA